MALTLDITPFAPWQSLKPVLDHLGWDGTFVAPDSPCEPNRQLLLHTRPEWAAAWALEQGDNPNDILRAWNKQAEVFLSNFKRHRDCVAMVDVLPALSHPKALLEWLAGNHQAFAGIESTDFPLQSKPERPSDLNLMLAVQLVAQTPNLPPLIAQLEACSIPLETGSITHVANVETAVQQLKALSDNAQQSQKALAESRRLHEQKEQALQEEADLLLNQLFLVQEELQRVSAESHDPKAQVSQSSNKKRPTQVGKKQTSQSSKKPVSQSGKKPVTSKPVKIKTTPPTNASNKLIRENGKLRRAAVSRTRSFVKLFNVKSKKLNSEIKMIKSSGLLDPKWYLNQYPDVATSYLSPAEHYVRFGASEGRSPGPDFDSKQYLIRHPEVTESGQNPLVHYLLKQKQKGAE